MKFLNQAKGSEPEDSELDPSCEPQPIFFFPDKCPRCRGEGCIMCEESESSIRAARLGDMTIKRWP